MNTGASESLLLSAPALRNSLQTFLSLAAAGLFTVSPTVNVTPKYNIGLPIFLSQRIGGNAAGGYVSGSPQLSWLAEEGYGEYIIPTNPSRRTRALELYEQAGEALGVGRHAAGGFVGSETGLYMGRSIDALNYCGYGLNNVPADNNEATEDDYGSVVPVSRDSGQTSSVQVNVNMNPEFHISSPEGQSEEDIVNVVKRHIREMADEIGGEIAIRLEEVFSNMPLKAGQ